MPKPLAIVNPAADSGRCGRNWPGMQADIMKVIGPIDVAPTTAVGDARKLAARAVDEGRETVIAVGGDGTLHEVVNGLARGHAGPPDHLRLGIVNKGSGGDFCRTLGIARGASSFLAAAQGDRERLVDLGRITSGDAAAPRWFINIANAGFSGEVTDVIANSRLQRLVGPKLAYLLAVASTMRRYGGRSVRIRLDEAPVFELDISTLAIANGRFFGSGMLVAPMADLGDGLLEMIVFLTSPRIRISDIRKVYDGSHLGHPAVRTFRAASIRIEPGDSRSVMTDADGEPVGTLPATFDCKRQALRIIV